MLHPATDVFGFGGQWGYYTDAETGLILLTNRYYDAGTGRFLNRDPLSYAGGINLYGFVGGNPLSFTDPLGLVSGRTVAIVGAGVIGGLAGSEFGPVGTAIGIGVGVALASLVLGDDIGAAADAGLGATCQVLSVLELGSAAGSVLPRSGQLSLPFEEFEEEAEGPAAAGVEGLAARASQVNGVLRPRAQNHTTTAVLQTSAGTIVGGSGADLTAAQVKMVQAAGEIPAQLPGAHAEITAIAKATEMGVFPQAIGTSRPFCPICRAVIEASGGQVVTPRTAVWPKEGE